MTQPGEEDTMDYHPNMQEVDPNQKHGACFLKQERQCGPDCMAFLVDPPKGDAYLGENWARCHLLVNADRGGRHLAILANVSAGLFQLIKNRAADEARDNQPSPQEPR